MIQKISAWVEARAGEVLGAPVGVGGGHRQAEAGPMEGPPRSQYALCLIPRRTVIHRIFMSSFSDQFSM